MAGTTCRAIESDPSLLLPAYHATNPPYTLLHALPDPCRAIVDTSLSSSYNRDNAYAEI